jgi:hypothetical protein
MLISLYCVDTGDEVRYVDSYIKRKADDDGNTHGKYDLKRK